MAIGTAVDHSGTGVEARGICRGSKDRLRRRSHVNGEHLAEDSPTRYTKIFSAQKLRSGRQALLRHVRGGKRAPQYAGMMHSVVN